LEAGGTTAGKNLLLSLQLIRGRDSTSMAVTHDRFWRAALAHQSDFDVCWCKGSVSEKIFMPLVEKIKSAGGKIQGSTFVTDVQVDATQQVKAPHYWRFYSPQLQEVIRPD
jgi:hypothetical protein